MIAAVGSLFYTCPMRAQTTARYRRLVILPVAFGCVVTAATYEVGPGKTYSSIGAAPLASLQPGDTVKIYHRSTPYREKFVICRQGTAAAPITILGVAGPAGELPVIEGIGAVTAPGRERRPWPRRESCAPDAASVPGRSGQIYSNWARRSRMRAQARRRMDAERPKYI